MSVKALCKTDVVTVRPRDELNTAAALMRDQHVGYLIVAEPSPLGGWGKPLGVLTDRDLVVEVLAKGLDPKSVTVQDVMSPDPVVVEESKPLGDVLDEMRHTGIRRVPVVGLEGQLVGVLSLDAVVEHLAKEIADLSGSIRTELGIERQLRP